MDSKITRKSAAEIDIMAEGGKKLSKVKNELKKAIKIGVSAGQVEDLAASLIEKAGGKASFKMVPGYRWATCVNVNDGIVHGIPKKTIVFKKDDIVSVDVGIFYRGFHTDTSFSVYLGDDKGKVHFIETGKKTLEKAIDAARAGSRVYDISQKIESILKKEGYSPIRALVGHGVGKNLHEGPQIPCFTNSKRKESPEIPIGAVLAIEVMYSMGSGDVHLDEDGWTIAASDGTISGLFEETVAVTEEGPRILTDNYKDIKS